MKKPLFLTVVVAASIGAGVLADRNWLRAGVDDGAQCEFVRPVAKAPTPALVAPTGPCDGTALPVGGSPMAGGLMRPECPGKPSARATVAPVAPVATVARPALRPAPSGDDSRTTLIALGGLLGLLGLGAIWRQIGRGGARRRASRAAAAALAPVAAAADPARVDEPEWRPHKPSPHVAAADDPTEADFVPADPGDRMLRGEARRRARAARQAGWRRLAYLLLFGGSVAAVAASTSRGMWAGEFAPDRRGVEDRVHRPVTLAEPGGSSPSTPRVAGFPARGTENRPLGLSAPSASPGRISINAAPNGFSRGTVADSRSGRIIIPDERGERLGAHLFDANGAGEPIVHDPKRGGSEDRLSSSGSGGGGGSAGGNGGGNGTGRGGNITPSGGSANLPDTGGGKTGGNGGPGGVADTGPDDHTGNGGNGGDGGNGGNGDGNGNGGGPDNWLGNDNSHGGSTEVPEPDTIGLLALGIVGLALSRSRRLRQKLLPGKPAQ